jgi:hypothetical protein
LSDDLLREHFQAVAKLRDDILLELKEGRRGERVRQDIARLKELLREESLSPAYHAVQGQIIEQLKAHFAAMTDLKERSAAWPKISLRAQNAFLKRCLSAHAEFQSAAANLNVQPAGLEAGRYIGNDGEAKAIMYDETGRRDLIRLGHNQNRLSNMLSSLAHEQTHIFHAWLARAVDQETIGPGHSLYNDGKFFILREEAKAYVSDDILSAYEIQVDEADADRIGMEIQNLVRSRESPLLSAVAGAIGKGFSVAGSIFTSNPSSGNRPMPG